MKPEVCEFTIFFGNGVIDMNHIVSYHIVALDMAWLMYVTTRGRGDCI